MTVSSATNRVSFSGNASTTVFAYNFKIFAQTDLTVILRAADGTETTQSLTTHYSVSGVGAASGGNVTFGSAPASGVTVVILREQPLTQGLDLVANDPFPSASVEDSLDKLTMMVQQHDEELGRAIKASKTNTISGAEFTVSATDRANKVFSFDASGNLSITQELGTFTGNFASSTAYQVRDLIKDTSTNNIFLVNAAHTSSGSQPLTTNANASKYTLIIDAGSASSSATAASGSASAASASEGNSSGSATSAANAQAAAETARDAAVVAKNAAETAFDNLDDRYLGAKSSNPSADNDGNALVTGALFFHTGDGEMKVFDGTSFITITVASSNQSNINTVANISSNIGTVAGISGNVTTVAGIAANVTTVAADGSDIGAVAGAISNVNTVAGIAANVTTVASANSNIATVASANSNISTVAGIAANVTTVANDSSNISTLVTDLSGTDTIGTVAGAIANVNNVGGSIQNVNTVASNLASVNTFGSTYKISQNAPTTNLIDGMLWWDSTNDVMKVYNASSSSFVLAGSSVNGTSNRYDYVVGTNSGAYTTASTSVFPATYDAGFVDVYLNGAKLIPSTDFSATNGTTVTLSAAATAGDNIAIVGFGTFSVATDLAKTGGTMTGDIVFASTQTFDGVDVSALNTSVSGKANLSGATFTGDIDAGANKILYANMYSAQGDLPNAATYHGMFAHVHQSAKAVYAHGGNWLNLVSEDSSGTVKFDHAIEETTYTLSGTALDPANGTIQTKAFSGNTTLTDSLTTGESMVLQTTGGASHTIIWPTITWVTSAGNTAPTLTAADTVVLWKVSSTLYGAYAGSSA